MGPEPESSQSDKVMDEKPATKTSKKPRKVSLVDRLPLWITANLNVPSFKLLFRCWVAAWGAWILMVPNTSLRILGNAAFFACMVTVMVPPSFPVQLYFLAMTTLLVGCLFGWAWGSAAMRASLTARDQVLLLSQLRLAKQSAASSANPDAEFKLEIFQGAFLDWRSSLVYGCFLGVGVFFLASARAASPRLGLFSIFGTIFLDVICSYGPLFPAPNYMLLNSFFISTTSSMAIGCVAIIFIFPETLNHSVLNGVVKLMGAIRGLIDIQQKVLNVEVSEDLAADSELRIEIQKMLDGAFGGIQKIWGITSMLSIEFSYGKFNGEDIRSLIEPVGILISKASGLQNLAKLVGHDNENIGSILDQTSSQQHGKDSGSQDDPDGYLWGGIDNSSAPMEQERTLLVKEVFPLLRSATRDLREACSDVLKISGELITDVNTHRWKSRKNSDFDLDAKLDNLRSVLDNFKQTRRLEVVEPFKHFQTAPKDVTGVSRRMLFYAFVFEANLVWVAEAIVAVAELLAVIAGKRKKARLWAPKSLRSLWKILMMSEEKEFAAERPDEAPADPAEIERAQMVEKRDPDSKPPSNLFQHIGQILYILYEWSKTSNALYALKYTVISIALWLPAVFRTSAFFSYSNKGLWALIMAQTTLEPYMADQIYSYFSRLTAIVGGLIAGLAGWYIGAGQGHGNPYGMSAVMAVLLVPTLFARINNPSMTPTIMFGVTAILVIGYSWIDARLATVGNPGIGWSVGWRRWVLVLIGSGASAIMMFIPPRSARKAIRLENASMIFRFSQLYGMLISEWIDVEEKSIAQEKIDPNRSGTYWSEKFRKEYIKVATNVQTLQTRTTLAKWEGSFRGAWPVEEYKELSEIQAEMLSYLAQLAGAVYHLDPVWRKRLVHRTKFLNPDFISEVMSIFSLVSRSLRTAEPLQETLPKNLHERLFYHHRRRVQTENDAGGDADHWAELNSVQYMDFAAGVSAVYMIIKLLDRLHQVTVKLCGEVPLRGFSEWKDIYNAKEV